MYTHPLSDTDHSSSLPLPTAVLSSPEPYPFLEISTSTLSDPVITPSEVNQSVSSTSACVVRSSSSVMLGPYVGRSGISFSPRSWNSDDQDNTDQTTFLSLNKAQVDRWIREDLQMPQVASVLFAQDVDGLFLVEDLKKDKLMDDLRDLLAEEDILKLQEAIRQRLYPTPNIKKQNEDEVRARDWNAEFQDLIDALRNNSEPKELIFTKLSDLGDSFLYSAESYGKIILSEACLKVEDKTIKPVDIGGLAGGQKFKANGILFKFPSYQKKMYKTDENARRAAGQELVGLVSFFDCNIPGLYFPLTCIIDRFGLRLVAQAILPIKPPITLVHGSADQGRSVVHHCLEVITAENQKIDCITELGKKLNLAAHLVIGSDHDIFYTAADVEVHEGTDKRYYMLDFGRGFPLEAKTPIAFFRQLRPEFCRNYQQPLSPDSKTGFANKIDAEEHERVLDKAKQDLYAIYIPRVADTLAARYPQRFAHRKVLDGKRLVAEIHREGVNIRHLGYVREYLLSKKSNECEHVEKTLLREMVCRILKEELSQQMRQKMKQLHTPTLKPYKKVIADHYNFWLSSEELWKSTVKERIQEKFECGLTPGEIHPQHDLRDDLRSAIDIAERLGEIMGIKLYPEASNELKSKSFQYGEKRTFTVLDSDIEDIQAVVKPMNIIAYAQGVELFSMFEKTKSILGRGRLLKMANEHFWHSNLYMAADPDKIRRWGYCLYELTRNTFDQAFNRAYNINDQTIRNAELRECRNCLLLNVISTMDKFSSIDDIDFLPFVAKFGLDSIDRIDYYVHDPNDVKCHLLRPLIEYILSHNPVTMLIHEDPAHTQRLCFPWFHLLYTYFLNMDRRVDKLCGDVEAILTPLARATVLTNERLEWLSDKEYMKDLLYMVTNNFVGDFLFYQDPQIWKGPVTPFFVHLDFQSVSVEDLVKLNHHFPIQELSIGRGYELTKAKNLISSLNLFESVRSFELRSEQITLEAFYELVKSTPPNIEHLKINGITIKEEREQVNSHFLQEKENSLHLVSNETEGTGALMEHLKPKIGENVSQFWNDKLISLTKLTRTCVSGIQDICTEHTCAVMLLSPEAKEPLKWEVNHNRYVMSAPDYFSNVFQKIETVLGSSQSM